MTRLERMSPAHLILTRKTSLRFVNQHQLNYRKRLPIDLCVLRQAYDRREHTNVVWLPSENIPANALTRSKETDAIRKVMMTNRFSANAKPWIERPVKL